jgi:hypothetical protein
LPYRRALDAWVNSPEGTLLGDLITKEFELLVRTLDKSPARGVAGPRAALATTARRARAG